MEDYVHVDDLSAVDPFLWDGEECELLRQIRKGYHRIVYELECDPDAEGRYLRDFTKEFPLSSRDERMFEFAGRISRLLVCLITYFPGEASTKSIVEWFQKRALFSRHPKDDPEIRAAESEFLDLKLPWDAGSLKMLRNAHRVMKHDDLVTKIEALSSQLASE